MNKGLIKITNDLYVNNWALLHVIMKDFRPTHIEFRHWENDIWYIYGVSDMFDELKEGDAVPEYRVIFTTVQNEYISHEFKRV